MNGDGKITVADAQAVLRMAVKLANVKVASFSMVPEDMTFWDSNAQAFTVTKSAVPTDFATSTSLSNTTAANYVAVLSGDVNGSYVPLTQANQVPSSYAKLDDSYFTDTSQAASDVPIDLWAVAPNLILGDGDANILDDTLGRDSFIGGGGADLFRFLAAGDSAVGASRDRIGDFSTAQGDLIDLSAIDANDILPDRQGFSFLGISPFSAAAGELRYDVTGPGAIVQASIAGSTPLFEIRLAGVITLAATEFTL